MPQASSFVLRSCLWHLRDTTDALICLVSIGSSLESHIFLLQSVKYVAIILFCILDVSHNNIDDFISLCIKRYNYLNQLFMNTYMLLVS